MKVLIACECSGIVRESFRALGHDAWSVDIQPSELPGQHIQGDVLTVLDNGWDLMIAHPPCTYLSRAGARYWKDPKRAQLTQDAMQFFMVLWCAPIPFICVENTIGKKLDPIHEDLVEAYREVSPCVRRHVTLRFVGHSWRVVGEWYEVHAESGK